MKVIVGGDEIELGTAEATPTVGLIDYSRRETDQFGVTTVVKRDFARRLSVRMALPFEDAAAHARAVARETAANRSSMLQDVEQGRPTEIGALNDAVVAEGARLGVPTPLNRAVTALIRDLEARSVTPAAG